MAKEAEVKVEIREMSRKQIKALRKASLDPALQDKVDNKFSMNMVDWILDNVYADVDTDEMPYHAGLKLAMDTYKVAMGGSAAVKN